MCTTKSKRLAVETANKQLKEHKKMYSLDFKFS